MVVMVMVIAVITMLILVIIELGGGSVCPLMVMGDKMRAKYAFARSINRNPLTHFLLARRGKFVRQHRPGKT